MCRAEKGLSNYLIFQTAKTDPKIAAHAAEIDKFEDDEEGRLVKVLDTPRVIAYKHARPSPEAQAKGVIEPHLKASADQAEAYRKAGKAASKAAKSTGEGSPASSSSNGSSKGKVSLKDAIR